MALRKAERPIDNRPNQRMWFVAKVKYHGKKPHTTHENTNIVGTTSNKARLFHKNRNNGTLGEKTWVTLYMHRSSDFDDMIYFWKFHMNKWISEKGWWYIFLDPIMIYIYFFQANDWSEEGVFYD